MFFDGNVYDRATTDGQTRPSSTFVNADGSAGQAKYLRVLEAIPIPRDGNKRGQSIGNTNFEKQRVIGYASIRPDGSFSIEVPANRSIHVQTLDQHGVMLVNQLSWIQVMPGEKRLCTGCHDSHDRDRVINDLQVQNNHVLNRARGSEYASGFHNADVVMSHPAARTDTVDFFDRYRTNRTNTVQDIFDRRCISCHGTDTPAGGLTLKTTAADLTPPPNPFTNTTSSVYETVTKNSRYRTATNNPMPYVHDHNGAKNSPLVWVMFGKQLDDQSNRDYRPLSYDHTQIWTRDQFNRIDPFLPANRDLLTMIEWVDMGTQFSNTIGR